VIYGSVCSGIEAATVAWEPLGWRAAFYSEIDAFPSAVLNHYYPDVPNHGDMTRFKEWPDANLDILVGGTPCQSFSVAGLRKGLDDPRGNLTLVYLAVADNFRPRWLVWENVPGVLSNNRGRVFGAFLWALAELGYGFAYRVLDAQFFGVPQQRRRIFLVAHLGDWRRAAAVLFEPESLRRDIEQGKKAKKADCGKPACSSGARGVDAFLGRDITIAIDASYAKGVGGTSAAERPVVAHGERVRRLMPLEIERLQGFPDDHTRILFKGKPAGDAARYRALGNSMAVPVMRWLGERIHAVEQIQ
jgi:DNA (cytosine-5)-methyltransferase 1